MKKNDILEIKRRFKKESCTFTRMCGCYVDADLNKITKLGETFLNLEDDEFLKYLDLAKKVLSGSIGNNLIEYEFPFVEESAGGKQQFLMGLRESKLKNDDLLDVFYDMVIDSYDYVGNYLILIFHDAYDVMKMTSDKNKLDESEEVYEYLLCAICPVKLSKPGLGYHVDDNSIGPRTRDWVVGNPDAGFVFPAFTDRSTDIHSVLCYNRDTKRPHNEFVEDGLGCKAKLTTTEKKEIFKDAVVSVIGEDDSESQHIYAEIHEKLNEMVPEAESKDSDTVLSDEVIKNVLDELSIPQDQSSIILRYMSDLPADTQIEEVIDKKAVNEAEKERTVYNFRQLLSEAAQKLVGIDNELANRIQTALEEK